MRIIIEESGQRLDITDDMVDKLEIKFPHGYVDVPCDCTDGPCGWVHRKPTDECRFEMSVDLSKRPLWKEIPYCGN